MMTLPMDGLTSPSTRELVQRLYKKNIELENGLRKSAKSKIPLDPNVWLQLRENYETIVLEDHEFSEQHDVEISLWQLHYRRIEEFRAHMNAALATKSSSTSSETVKAKNHSERLKKIRAFFKSFLSEATGFYHELMQKIRSKYGLPLICFSEYPENQIISENDGKKLAHLKKGLLSCHRCLIYLGDLARYKGLYGDGESSLCDYAAASSYYVQATRLCPSSGNPHHQLAILASYSGDELNALYRYFRSLAVDNPFSTARDNLIIAFEKNRLNYSQLTNSNKIPSVKTVSRQTNERGRGKDNGDNTILSKDGYCGLTLGKGKSLSIPEIFKTFSTRFVRLNGILYTRTSLETFEDNFSLVASGLNELLSSGLEEELNFGTDAAENALLVLRLITILIFTVHNVNKESEGQSYAEILQRSALLQNAFVAAFEFAGHIVKRCSQLRDVSSTYLLPGVMIFMEWLACNPQIASGDDDEKQSSARSFFWNHAVTLLNKLLLCGLVSVDSDEDEVCFSSMGIYEEEETENRHALWEDFELRGFIPLAPAHLILDFSSKPSLGSDGSKKEKRARMQRILAAGRSIMDIVNVNQHKIYFDSRLKKFIIGPQFAASEADLTSGLLDISPNGAINYPLIDRDAGHVQSNKTCPEEEEEVIVFQPSMVEKNSKVPIPAPYDAIHPGPSTTRSGITNHVETLPSPNMAPHTALHPQVLAHTHIADAYSIQHSKASTSKWFMEQGTYLPDGSLRNAKFNENAGSQEGLSTLQSNAFSVSFPMIANANINDKPVGQMKASNFDSMSAPAWISEDMSINFSTAIPMNTKKNPVSRPVRHSGPPPGFGQVPLKQIEHSSSILGLKVQDPLRDDYSWLDGYKPVSTKGPLIESPAGLTAHVSYVNPIANGSVSTTGFPFPGKQIPKLQTELINDNEWRDHSKLLENLKPYSEKQLQANQLNGPSLEQYQAQRPSRYYF